MALGSVEEFCFEAISFFASFILVYPFTFGSNFSFRYILESASFQLFFKFVELPNFDVASDAFSTFKVRSMSV